MSEVNENFPGQHRFFFPLWSVLCRKHARVEKLSARCLHAASEPSVQATSARSPMGITDHCTPSPFLHSICCAPSCTCFMGLVFLVKIYKKSCLSNLILSPCVLSQRPLTRDTHITTTWEFAASEIVTCTLSIKEAEAGELLLSLRPG